MGGVPAERQWARVKPAGKEDYLTLYQLAELVGRSKARIRQLERQGRVPSPIRVPLGRRVSVRLYSPAQVRKVVEHFEREGRRYDRYDRSSKNLTTAEQLALAEERLANGLVRERAYYKRRVRYLRDKLKKELTTS